MRIRKVKDAESIINLCKNIINKPELHKGMWDKQFNNSNPIHLEIGMGKGDFIIGMAKLYPDINFIGIERFSSVIARATEKLIDENIPNLRLILFDAEKLNEIFDVQEIDTIYLNFSDPWPKSKHTKRRLTSKSYIDRYKSVLKENGVIRQKTDNNKLFDFSLELFMESNFTVEEVSYDLHNSSIPNEVMTEYEKNFLEWV